MPAGERLSSSPEEVERQLMHWNTLFSMIVEQARHGNYQPGAKFFQGVTPTIEDASLVRVVVNPSMTYADGFPRIVIVNLYGEVDSEHPIGKHYQQFTAASNWQKGSPDVQRVEEVILSTDGPRSSVPNAAKLAVQITSGYVSQKLFTMPQSPRMQ